MKKVLLLGAGHAQLSVLASLAAARMPGGELLLVTAYPRQVYSGMVPGLIAGRYSEDDCAIDVVPLAKAAGVHLRIGQATALDAAARQVTLADGERIGYDVLSINTGPVQDRDRIPGAREHALFVRPIETFMALWKQTRAMADERPLSVVVIGNGAAGVELVLAVRAALGARAELSIVCDGPPLEGYNPRAKRKAVAALKRAKVQVLLGRCTAIERRHVIVGPARTKPCSSPSAAMRRRGWAQAAWPSTNRVSCASAPRCRAPATPTCSPPATSSCATTCRTREAASMRCAPARYWRPTCVPSSPAARSHRTCRSRNRSTCWPPATEAPSAVGAHGPHRAG
jgi:NAD(P)H-nitrite reductase large subunit